VGDPQLLLFSYLEHLFGIRVHPLSLPLVIDVGTSAMSAAISTDVVADIILCTFVVLIRLLFTPLPAATA